jgi:hypothetical protein
MRVSDFSRLGLHFQKASKMKALTLSRSALGISAAAALLAGCGAQGAMPQASALATRATHGGSWALPEAATSDLLYVSDAGYLSMYTYPKGKLVGTIHNDNFNILAGECVDAKGDVFVSNLGNGKVFEYKHGSKKLLETLDPPAAEEALDCSIDPTTGNLVSLTSKELAAPKEASPSMLTRRGRRKYTRLLTSMAISFAVTITEGTCSSTVSVLAWELSISRNSRRGGASS